MSYPSLRCDAHTQLDSITPEGQSCADQMSRFFSSRLCLAGCGFGCGFGCASMILFFTACACVVKCFRGPIGS